MSLQGKEIEQLLSKAISEQGFASFGVTALNRPLSLDVYKNWLDENQFGEMTYLKTHLEQKETPQKISPRLKSALVFTHEYFPHPKPMPETPLQHARRAMYSKGEDYHFWLKEKLNALIEVLKTQYPHEEFISFTDSAPVLERDLAYRAGLGWFGKNSCLIHPKKGSLFFICEIYTSLEINTEIAPIADFCGTCTRCIDICPTQAIRSDKTLEATKCISYLTIESREIPPEPLREKMGDWFFGCDLCQTTCPWNQKIFKNQLSVKHKEELSDQTLRENLVADLRWALTTSGKQIQKALFGTAMMRAGPFGVRRNAIVVAANQNLAELKNEIEFWKKDEKLEPLVTWALKNIQNELKHQS